VEVDDLTGVSNPWREAIEEGMCVTILGIWSRFPILGGRLLKEETDVKEYDWDSFQSLEGGY